MKFDGDAAISGNDRHLWSLCYSTLERFGCRTIFKVSSPHSLLEVDRIVTFYVPGTDPRAHEVVSYLEEEMRGDVVAGEKIGAAYVPGTSVRVVLFGGLASYITRDELRPTIENAVKLFMPGAGKTPSR
jgi:hypothetical protein